MITKYINTDYKYPIHIYFDKQQISDITYDMIIRNSELHTYYNSACSGICDHIECPIEYECTNNSNLYHLIPDNIKNKYPELFI